MMPKFWPQAGQELHSTNTANLENQVSADAENVHSLSLELLRAQINKIDEQLVALLLSRFELADQILQEKIKIGKEIKDQGRETEVLARVAELCNEHDAKDNVQNVIRSVMKESVEFQKSKNQMNTSAADKIFPSACIIGTGLIGGALARRIKESSPASCLFAVDKAENLNTLSQSGLFEEVTATLNSSMLSNCNLIVLACPPESSIEILQSIAPMLSAGQVIIDLCSTKSSICNVANELDLNGAEFIGAHPFFGSEKQGFIESGSVETASRTFCIVPGGKSSSITVARLRNWLSELGFNVFISTAEDHDRTVAKTSHLIQLFAAALGSTIFEDLVLEGKEEHIALSGGAFAGLSRLMNSPSNLWCELSKQNASELKLAREKVFSKISRLINSAENGSATEFQAIFEEAQKCKSKCINS